MVTDSGCSRKQVKAGVDSSYVSELNILQTWAFTDQGLRLLTFGLKPNGSAFLPEIQIDHQFDGFCYLASGAFSL